jgi:PAS domain S-box-containing protein
MKIPLRLLMVEDSADDAGLVVDALEESGYAVAWERVDTADAMRAALEHRPWDLVISDYRMPQFSGPAALELLRSSGRELPFIVVSGRIGEEVAVAMMKAGADDYLMKGGLTRLAPTVAHTLAEHQLRREHHRVEAALHVQSAALTATATPIVITERTGAIIWVNPAFTALTGYSAAEAIGKDPHELLHSGRQEKAFYAEMWATILAGRVWRGELVNRRKDGTLYPEEMTITPVRSAAGEITHFIAIQQDLTERKLVEEMVQASRRQFQAVFEQATVGMVISEGDDGRFLLINRRFCEIVGYTEAELRQLTTRAITHPEDTAGDLDQMAHMHSGLNREFAREKRFRKKDGTDVWTKVYIAPLDPPETDSTRRVVVVQDITERKRAEAILRDSADRYLRQRDALVALTVKGAHHPSDLAGTMARIVEIAARTMGVARASVWRYTAGRAAIRCQALYEPGPDRHSSGLEFNAATYPIYFPALEEADVVAVADARSDPRTRDFWATYLGPLGIGSLLEAPIHVHGVVDGVFSCEHVGPPRVWSADEEAFATAVASLVSLAAEESMRQQSEQALRENELQLKESQSIANLGSYVFEAATGRWTSTEVLDRIFGIGPDYDHSVEGWLALIHPEDRAMMTDYFKNEVLGRGRMFNKEYRIIRQTDREVRWVSGIGKLEFDAEGRVRRMIGTVQDITERKQAEAALQREEALFNSLVSTIPDHIYFKDRQCRFIRINAAQARRFGLRSPDEAIGKTDADFFSAAHARQAYADEQRIMETGEPMVGTEERETWPDGRVTWVSTTKVALRDAEGRITGLVGVSRDITEQKLLEEKFLHAQRLESIGMLAAGIAHDLNNVLAPIVFAAPMLRSNLTAERDLRILSTLEASAERGAGLVKQILGFAHSTSGEFRPTQVKHLARDIMSVIEETFPKSIEFRHEVPSGLWPVQGNPTQLHQVLMNLCVNARDAMPQGGILTLTAANRRLDAAEAREIAGTHAGDWLVVTVSDTGTGIAPEVRDKIWTPFFTTKGVGRGTGLGLTTTRSIVANHHGVITLDTAVGRGTTFTVFLPALIAEEDRKKSASPFAPQPGNGELILVVDDDAAVHSLIAAILSKFGYRVQQCHDGLDALTFFNTRPADVALVITDVDMPRIGGVALARTLLQIRPDLPILAMSGLSHHDAASPDVPVIRSLAKAFLEKPFRAETLLAAVHQLLHQTHPPQPS